MCGLNPSGDGPAAEGSFAAPGELTVLLYCSPPEAQVLSVLSHVTGGLRIFPGEIDWCF